MDFNLPLGSRADHRNVTFTVRKNNGDGKAPGAIAARFSFSQFESLGDSAHPFGFDFGAGFGLSRALSLSWGR
jgi:hypothetical protein